MSVTYQFEKFSFEVKCLTAWEDEEDTHLKQMQFVNINLSSVDF